MLDRDLAELYGVKTQVLNQAVKRNIERFPEDFAFQLNNNEFQHWISQFVISNPKLKMGARKSPWVFSEHGILMLSSVLRSKRAIQVNIEIMRVFVRLREFILNHEKIWNEIIKMKKTNSQQFRLVFEAIRKLQEVEVKPQRKIGFKNGG